MSAFAARAGLVLGQRANAEESNEKTAIPQLLGALALDGCIVTLDAMGTQASIAQAIRDRAADYVLAVQDNPPTLADSTGDFFALFKAAPEKPSPPERDSGEGSRAFGEAALLRL